MYFSRSTIGYHLACSASLIHTSAIVTERLSGERDGRKWFPLVSAGYHMFRRRVVEISNRDYESRAVHVMPNAILAGRSSVPFREAVSNGGWRLGKDNCWIRRAGSTTGIRNSKILRFAGIRQGNVTSAMKQCTSTTTSPYFTTKRTYAVRRREHEELHRVGECSIECVNAEVYKSSRR
ncbi:hypothetical protein AB1N83_010445 [Pleurotus pulmonarius]